MNTTLVEDIIKRSNMRLTLLSTGGIVLVLLGVLLSASYLMNFISGPFKTSKDQVLSYTDPGQISRNFVTVRGDDVFDTGFQYVTTTDSGKETVDNSYAALLLDDRLLLVETKGASSDFPLEYTGALVPIPGDLQQNVIYACSNKIFLKSLGLFCPSC